jgi:hypothetical protein
MRAGAAFAHITMQLECAKHAKKVLGQLSRKCSGSAIPEHMVGSATASIYMPSSNEGGSMVKNKVSSCPGPCSSVCRV